MDIFYPVVVSISFNENVKIKKLNLIWWIMEKRGMSIVGNLTMWHFIIFQISKIYYSWWINPKFSQHVKSRFVSANELFLNITHQWNLVISCTRMISPLFDFFFIKYHLLLIIIKFLLLNIIPCTRENKIIIINQYIAIDPDLISDVDSINTNFASSNSILKIIIINFTIKLNCVSCSSRYVNILLQKKKKSIYIKVSSFFRNNWIEKLLISYQDEIEN